jgi:hypothetical protein
MAAIQELRGLIDQLKAKGLRERMLEVWAKL